MTGDVRQRLAARALGRAEMRALMLATYRSFVADNAGAFGAAIAAMVAVPARPLLVHCTAGKDRTGFLVAVLHALAGVPRDAIVADYEATNAHWDRSSVADLLRFDADAVEPLLAADPDYLAAAFDEIERRDGSVASFLGRASAGRLAPDRINAWMSQG
jgi:protein-tyrosine phosphatase